ncbi:MAG TPA: hypothetical protein VEV41_07495 [Terriglobales bacterium]|nr:hypothetical protein [Terriglobales bacterium]
MTQHLVRTSSVGAEQATLDPIIQLFVEELEREESPHLWETTVEEARANHAKMQAASVHLAPADVTDLTIENADHRMPTERSKSAAAPTAKSARQHSTAPRTPIRLA